MTAPPGPFLHAQSPIEEQARASQFEDIGKQEAKYRQDSAAEVDRLERVINLGHRLLALKSAPGFQSFESAVTDMRTHAQNEMTVCVAGNEQLRILQGRCQALSSILALMRNTEQNIESLAQQLNTAKQKAESTIRPDGKVVPETVLGGF